MSINIRSISADEREAFHQTMAVPFVFDVTPERTERFNHVFELERLRAAFDGEQMVATFGAVSLQLTVPGASLATAGTTVVTVLPTHRRQGILRSLMTEHLAEVHRHGEPLAALWASESSIYGRFGYGPSSERVVMQLDKPYARFETPVDIQSTMQLVDKDQAATVFPEIFESLARLRPGMFLRSQGWWKHRILSDPAFARGDSTAHRRVLHRRAGEPAGYAIYRTRDDSATETIRVRLEELIGIDSEAERALWQYLFGIDLSAGIDYANQPVDDPLRWSLAEPRRMRRHIEDALWVRPIDVTACLNARQYSCAGSLVFQMRDELCPWNDGVYRLEAGQDGSGRCQRSESAAEMELTPFALGATYLGGQRFRDLARAGVLTGSEQALNRADTMFLWDPLPWCQEIF